ncbi:hypothetical protein BG011_005515 [Mortierella polycephala]|uniref:Uncharacterized protein n=1 Tax=Mortierella polycephala TaxID=41804 RepID=A0A9P6PXX3_9FUNG|nr:hypothetical protein BG011_005515 [Mortierella polycephala]
MSIGAPLLAMSSQDPSAQPAQSLQSSISSMFPSPPATPEPPHHKYLHSPEQPLESRLQEHRQQMRIDLVNPNHSFRPSSLELNERHGQQLVSQLEYYRQLQVMHCQRVRDIELLHLQHQKQYQHQHHQHQYQYHHQEQPLHLIKRFHLAQRMQQAQALHRAHQIQKIRYLQEIGRLQRPAGSSPVTGSSCAHEMERGDLDRVDIHSSAKNPTPHRLILRDILGTSQIPASRHRFPELARIALPSLDQIRKRRHHRFKCQARLRQPTATAVTTIRGSRPVGNKDRTPVPLLPLTATGIGSSAMSEQIPAAARSYSTTSFVPRPKAETAYKYQLCHRMAMQQQMVQEHTHRFRIFQAICLLQRARGAQVLDDLHTRKNRQLQTLAWVEALRQSKELEVPQ